MSQGEGRMYNECFLKMNCKKLVESEKTSELEAPAGFKRMGEGILLTIKYLKHHLKKYNLRMSHQFPLHQAHSDSILSIFSFVKMKFRNVHTGHFALI